MDLFRFCRNESVNHVTYILDLFGLSEEVIDVKLRVLFRLCRGATLYLHKWHQL